MLRLCGNREDAEDALADALVKAFQSSNQLKDDESFKAWLSIIARRACFKIMNHESLLKVASISDGSWFEDMLSSRNSENAESMALKDCIRTSIARIPPIYREVYVMCEIEDLDLKAVGAKLGLSLPAVKSRLHRAREIARAEFDRSLCIAS